MQKAIISLAFILAAGAQAFAQTPPVSDLKYATKLIQDTNKKTMKRDEVCIAVAGVGRAAWTYKEEKKVFPFELMNGDSPFFPLYLWAYQYGTHKASNRAEAQTAGLTMCMFNANNAYRAWETGRPLKIAELSCPDIFPGCK